MPSPTPNPTLTAVLLLEPPPFGAAEVVAGDVGVVVETEVGVALIAAAVALETDDAFDVGEALDDEAVVVCEILK